MALIRVPAERVSQQAVQGLIEEWVTRDGTDYGERECPLERRVEQVRVALAAGDVVIAYDPRTGHAALLSREQWQARRQGGECQ